MIYVSVPPTLEQSPEFPLNIFTVHRATYSTIWFTQVSFNFLWCLDLTFFLPGLLLFNLMILIIMSFKFLDPSHPVKQVQQDMSGLPTSQALFILWHQWIVQILFGNFTIFPLRILELLSEKGHLMSTIYSCTQNFSFFVISLFKEYEACWSWPELQIYCNFG